MKSLVTAVFAPALTSCTSFVLGISSSVLTLSAVPNGVDPYFDFGVLVLGDGAVGMVMNRFERFFGLERESPPKLCKE